MKKEIKEGRGIVVIITVQNVLVFGNKAVGVRFTSNGVHYDAELEVLKGVTKEHLKQYKAVKLIERGNLLKTITEIENNLVIEDATKNKELITALTKEITQPKVVEQPKEQPTNKPKQSNNGLKVFEVTIEVPFYDASLRKEVPKQFTAEFESKNALTARKDAKETYAQELGTVPEEVKIISAKLKE